MDWYLVPVAKLSEEAVAPANARGQPCHPPGFWFHVGKVEANPTEGLVGLPETSQPPRDWTRLTKAEAAQHFERLFHRTPEEKELP